LHDFDDTFQQRAKLFAKLGCNALYDDGDRTDPCNRPVVDPKRAAISGQLQDFSDFPDEWSPEDYLMMAGEF
jgi:hypothetical protein